MGLAPGAGDCGRNGRAVLMCANWALICAYGGVLSSRVGVLKDLTHKGLWATSMGNNYRPEKIIRDIYRENQWQHAPASLCVGCPDAQGQAVLCHESGEG